jgi:hypothetical protein
VRYEKTDPPGNLGGRVVGSYNPVEIVAAWLSRERIRVYVSATAILTVIGWAITQYLGPGMTNITGAILGGDFLGFYTGGKFFLESRMADLYNFAANSAFQSSIVYPVTYTKFHPFVYPPYSAAFYSLFSRSGYLTGLAFWMALGLILLFASVCLVRSELKPLRVYSVTQLFLGSFLFVPTLQWLINGQNSALSLFSYVVFFVMLRRSNDLAAGLSLALVIYKPQLILALGLMLLVTQRWRAILGVVLGSLAWIVTGLLTSPTAMKKYLEILPLLPNFYRYQSSIDTSMVHSPWAVNSFFGFATLLLDNIWVRGANIMFMLLSLGGITAVILIWRPITWKPGTREWDLSVAGTIVLGLLLSPQLHIYDLMLLLLPFAIILSYYAGSHERVLDGGPLLVWSALIYVTCWVGNLLAFLQTELFALMGLPKFGVQLIIIVMLGWVGAVVSARKSYSRT